MTRTIDTLKTPFSVTARKGSLRPGLPDQVSYSLIHRYLQCPLRCYFEYIAKREPAFVSASLPFGTSIHAALAAWLKAQQKGSVLSEDEVMGVFTEAWSQVHRSKIPIIYDRDDFDALQEKGIQMVRHFCHTYQPGVIVAVEEAFSVKLGPELDLVGRIDLVELDDSGTLCLTDFKTSSRKPTASHYQRDIQLTLYWLALKALQWMVQDIRLHYVVLVKTQSPQQHRVPVVTQDSDISWVMGLLIQVWKGIQQENFYPNPSYLCARCPYQEPCREWGY